MRPVKVASKSLDETSAVSSSVRATRGSRHRCSNVTLTLALARLLVFPSPKIFEEKRDCLQSIVNYSERDTNF